MGRLYSIGFYLYITVLRITDHAWRYVAGLPRYKYSQIYPYLYLGGQYTTRGLGTLKRMGITGIVNMRISPIYKRGYEHAFHFLHLPTHDWFPPTIENLKSGAEFIDNEITGNGKVYVHCRQGEGRGPSMVIAYLIYKGMTCEDAYRLVKKIRPFIRPTSAQIQRLKEFEQTLSSYGGPGQEIRSGKKTPQLTTHNPQPTTYVL